VARHRLEYGRRHGQHGDLWIADGPLPEPGRGRPVVILLHGGFWKAMYTKGLMTQLAADVMDRGWAAWNLEYRRLGGIPSGGWPATFEDVGAGIDHLASVAASFSLDLSRVVAVGHSAGGHLALWAAARGALPPGAPGAPGALGADGAAGAAGPAGAAGALGRAGGAGVAVGLCGVVGLAPVSDLAEAARMGLGGGAVARLMGGPPARHPDRYAVADPAQLLPMGVAQVLVHGDRDGAVPIALSRHYIEQAQAAGDPAVLVELPDIGHMELIDPASPAWTATVVHLRRLLA
jgi:acetyl esterase/lipase